MTTEAQQHADSSDVPKAASPLTAASDLGAASLPISDADGAEIDHITVVQDTIDRLSLSLFEALRGLRDAVAPESLMGSSTPAAGANQRDDSTPNDEPDYDDFLVAYHNKEPQALALVKRSGGKPPRTREDYVKLLARTEMEKDAELVSRLAEEVLSTSEALDELVAKLPGMGRTKTKQMARIEELLAENRKAEAELEAAYKEAGQRKKDVRAALQRVTCSALGIKEEG